MKGGRRFPTDAIVRAYSTCLQLYILHQLQQSIMFGAGASHRSSAADHIMHRGAARVPAHFEQDHYEHSHPQTVFHSPQQHRPAPVRTVHGRDHSQTRGPLPSRLGAGHLASALHRDRSRPSSARPLSTPADSDRALGSLAASKPQMGHVPPPSPIGSAGVCPHLMLPDHL